MDVGPGKGFAHVRSTRQLREEQQLQRSHMVFTLVQKPIVVCVRMHVLEIRKERRRRSSNYCGLLMDHLTTARTRKWKLMQSWEGGVCVHTFFLTQT